MSARNKRILRLLGLCAGITGAVVVLGFVERGARSRAIQAVRIHLDQQGGVHFMDEVALERIVLDQGAAVLGAPTGAVDLAMIEERLRSLPPVAHADAYTTMDGVLHVKVRQRVPIVRVCNADGTTFYLDEEGWAMPPSDAWSPRVPVAMGSLQETGAKHGVRHVADGDSLSPESMHIHRLAAFLSRDPLWCAFVDQVVVGADGNYTLVPTVGPQRIILGRPAEWPDDNALERSFNKLEHFYAQGVPRTGWRQYDKIDLRFRRQVVATQRTTP